MTILKYAGADWMPWYWESRRITPSPLGIKVADVLGQVFAGIYHVQDEVCDRSVAWDSSGRIRIKLS